MLTEILQYLRNWFVRSVYTGEVVIENEQLASIDGAAADTLFLDGQYIRIMGSVLNDGVYRYGTDALTDSTFNGTVWGLGIPAAVIALADEISAWQSKNGDAATSPFQSESFGGYSYSKGAGAGAAGDTSWKTAFASRLAPWRKL